MPKTNKAENKAENKTENKVENKVENKENKMKVVELKEAKQSCNLAEIHQYVMTEFTLVSPDMECLMPWMHCRDWLGDALTACHHNGSFSIWGMKYDTSEHPPASFDRTRIAIRDNEYFDTDEKAKHLMDIINLLEKNGRMNGYEDSDVYCCDEATYMFDLSNVWSTSPTMMSFLTTIMRACAPVILDININDKSPLKLLEEIKSKTFGNDKEYLENIITHKAYQKLIEAEEWREISLEERKEWARVLAPNNSTHAHDSGGIVSWCRNCLYIND